MYKIKFSAETDTRKITIEIPADIDTHDLLDTMRTLAIGLGYHEDSWDAAVCEQANYLEYRWQQRTV
jgi:hypothetical protein